jgi:uncharacterized membrane protein
MAFCTVCGAQTADGSAVCPTCRSAGQGSKPAGSTTGGLADNVAGMLAYVTIIPAIIFLVIEPYNRRRFVRFHAFQCIFFHIAWAGLWVVLSIIAHIPVLGWLTLLIWPLVGLAGFVIWLILLLKANQGQTWKLPFIGDLAEKQAGA